MKNQDKYAKVGTLSLRLQKYEISQQEKQELLNSQSPQKIQEQQISIPPIKLQNNESPKSYKGRTSSRDKHQQKSSSLRFTDKTPAVDLEDEEELLQKCMNLTGRIQILKRQKYEQAIQQFEEQERKKLDFLFDKQKKLISEKHNQKRAELKLIHERQSVRIAKGLQDTKKYKQAYNKICEDLIDKKQKLNREYEVSLQQIGQVKQKLISQWKRNSNEEIIKKCNLTIK